MAYNVVIIDDEPWTREVIRCLGKWDEFGLQIVGEASDGECGLELIRQVKPEIVITDVHMPHLNGLELISRVRDDANDALVLFISGYDEFEYVKSALVLGAANYLLKPIKEEELNDQLKKCSEVLRKQKEKEKEKQTRFFTGDFINASWANDFYSIRNEISEAIRAQQKNVLQKKFNDIKHITEKIPTTKKADVLEKPIIQEHMVGIYYSLTNILHRYISSCGYSLVQVFGERNTSFVFARHGTMDEMLQFVYQLYKIAIDKMEDIQRNKNKLDIERVKRYIEENYCNGITLEETASSFYVSKEYLSKLFKLRVGEGFSEYVTSKRMEKAKELICDLDIPLKDVCEMVGYIDLAHFYKAFKKYFGKTPGQLREELNIYNKIGLE